jgi:hypothetical protein
MDLASKQLSGVVTVPYPRTPVLVLLVGRLGPPSLVRALGWGGTGTTQLVGRRRRRQEMMLIEPLESVITTG